MEKASPESDVEMAEPVSRILEGRIQKSDKRLSIKNNPRFEVRV